MVKEADFVAYLTALHIDNNHLNCLYYNKLAIKLKGAVTMSMRGNKRSIKETGRNNVNHTPKWEHPKILLIDLDKEAEAILKAEGFNAVSGSFGRPYKVSKSDSFVPVILNETELPNYTEQEIIIIDLAPPKASSEPKGEKIVSEGEVDWWASCNKGIIDPRLRAMYHARNSFDRIFNSNGIFTIFAESRISPKQILARMSGYSFLKESDLHDDNWGFLSFLYSHNLDIRPDHGEEISIIDSQSVIGQILAEHIKGARFACTIHRSGAYNCEIENKMWQTLAVNKYSLPVACRIESKMSKGQIFIFPNLKNKALFINNFVKFALPELAPHLFPDFKIKAWVHNTPYEIAEIQELKREIALEEKRSNENIQELKRRIKLTRAEKAYLYDLLTESGRPLVLAVKKSLEALGFKSITDVDKEEASALPKREDLQIHDYSPILLVEVKGIAGLPKDEAALQVSKYLAPRMKEWGRTDLQGLSIINHQRNIPALDRENNQPFREDILINAEQQKFGLITTWELFRLTRSFLGNTWKHENIKDLFYNSGHIKVVPTHYQYVGVIENIWKNAGAIGVRIKESEISLIDHIAIAQEVIYSEHRIESLQVNDIAVKKVDIGALAGIKLNIESLKIGMRVYRILQQD